MVALRGDVVSCRTEGTGFLGMEGERAVAEVVNQDVEAGTFTVQFFGEYPGNGERIEGSGSATLGPRQQGTVRFDIHSATGRQGGTCRLVPPQVQRWM